MTVKHNEHYYIQIKTFDTTTFKDERVETKKESLSIHATTLEKLKARIEDVKKWFSYPPHWEMKREITYMGEIEKVITTRTIEIIPNALI